MGNKYFFQCLHNPNLLKLLYSKMLGLEITPLERILATPLLKEEIWKYNKYADVCRLWLNGRVYSTIWLGWDKDRYFKTDAGYVLPWFNKFMHFLLSNICLIIILMWISLIKLIHKIVHRTQNETKIKIYQL